MAEAIVAIGYAITAEAASTSLLYAAGVFLVEEAVLVATAAPLLEGRQLPNR